MSDAILAATCLDGDRGAIPEEAARHLLTCATCAARHETLKAFLDGVERAADEAADAGLTPERLAAQRQRIMHRLGTIVGSEPPARVLPFPAPGRAAPAATGRGRWLAASMAAGLLIGLVTGQLIDFRRPIGALQSLVVADRPVADRRAPSITRQARSNAAPAPTEEAFLVEIDAALDTESVAGLEAIDALTPRIREATLGAPR